MRLFFALPLPAPAKEALRPVFEAARRAGGEAVGFANFEQLHFTLAFLGETERLHDACAAAAGLGELPPFELAIAGAGAFPSPSRPRVLWLGVTAGALELVAVADRLRAGLRERAFALEARPFRPHLTLGRVRQRGEKGARRALSAVPAGELVSFRVSEIHLMHSLLGAGGARHSALRSFPLVSAG